MAIFYVAAKRRKKHKNKIPRLIISRSRTHHIEDPMRCGSPLFTVNSLMRDTNGAHGFHADCMLR